MKVWFEVPKGGHCGDCPHQKDFYVEETDITTYGDEGKRYTRYIAGECNLFAAEIRGIGFDRIHKCKSCIEQAE